MPNFVFLSLLLLYIVFLPFSGASISSCNGPCQYSSDCVGGLVCIGGKCKDVGTHIYTLESDHRNCEPSGSTTLFNGTVCLFYDCSPPVLTRGSTPAKLKYRDFQYSFPSECDGKLYPATERVAAMSTGWFNRGSRCGQMIRVFGGDGRSVVAEVVDECVSFRGCDEESEGKPPCGNDIIEGSEAVWKGLGLNNNDYSDGVNVTWSMA